MDWLYSLLGLWKKESRPTNFSVKQNVFVGRDMRDTIINIGVTEDDLRRLLQAELAQIAEEKGISFSVMQQILVAFGDEDASADREQIQKKLRAKADEYRNLRDQLERLKLDDPNASILRRQIGDIFFEQAKMIRYDIDVPGELIPARNSHWDQFQRSVMSLDSEKKFKVQRSNTLHYVKKYGLTVQIIKDKLNKIELYRGPLNDDITRDFIRSIELFQSIYNLRHVDGVFGPLTYEKLLEISSK